MLALTMANVKLVGASRYVHVHISSPVALARNRNPFTFFLILKFNEICTFIFFGACVAWIPMDCECVCISACDALN